MEKTNTFNRKITKTVFITLLMISAFALLVFHANFFLLVFAGIFFSVLLNFASNWLVKKTPLSYGFALFLILLFITGILYLIIILIGPSMVEQVEEMSNTLPQSLSNLKHEITQTPIGKNLFEELPSDLGALLENREEVMSRIVGSFSTTIGAIANFFIIIVTGIFLASSPNIYTSGFVRLFPLNFRPRLKEVMDKTQYTLSLWMVAKLISMLVVGVFTAIGLEILGMPMPYALALLAALFSFIPNIGPYLALAPAVLIALMQGGNMFIYVLILYFGIQIVESYLITPMIEKKMVSLPPALTLFWMVLLGVLTGILGLILATPILAALMVIIEELYVKDNLEANSLENKIKKPETAENVTGKKARGNMSANEKEK
ncbi:AI-2E family transporter [Antarcticibacterium sp. 1MA-6-2]|uniref:AI-2E family transporter n=1 Tax=Antarcticibacterium sp. 1MA-6-2 TaxID=2908210 RepID=UPI001F4700F2|nr:AI-2E family transporter [Antarcticibacterium sp. 1MA-6-2]UJH91164.1 AI-2E family transporter [Antarcticibacterium sp. 1MA-6-2]